MDSQRARSIADAAWATLADQISYKQAWRGGELIFTDRWLRSSKTCSGCGTVKDRLGLSRRTYQCEHCGLVIDRDLNAAINSPPGPRHTPRLRSAKQTPGTQTPTERHALTAAHPAVKRTSTKWERPTSRSRHDPVRRPRRAVPNELVDTL
jgi:Putative transposase DNA-binding domain